MDRRELGRKDMDRQDVIKLTQKIAQEFSYSVCTVELAMLLDNRFLDNTDKQDGTYTLLFSSKYLDDMNPFRSTLEVVKFFRKNNNHILKKISRIITIHSKDENVVKIKKMMSNKEENYSIDSNIYKKDGSKKRHIFFGTTIKDGVILKIYPELITSY